MIKIYLFQRRGQSNIVVFKAMDSIFPHCLAKLKCQNKKISKIK